MSESPKQTKGFINLLIEYQGVIRSYIMSLVPNNPDTEDILQDVNLLLWEKQGSFQVGSNFGAWACTVAYYKVLDYRKSQKRKSVLIFDTALCELLMEREEPQTPDVLRGKRNALKHCLDQLRPKDKSLLKTSYSSSSRNLEQISMDTGRSQASLSVTLHRLRKNLRLCISKRLKLSNKAAL